LFWFVKVQPAKKEDIVKEQHTTYNDIYYQYPTHNANKKERTQIPIEYINNRQLNIALKKLFMQIKTAS
jgi:hypothetical protein